MRLERTMAGLEARLTPSGGGRWGGAIFLAVWLVFWVAGEVLVAGILIVGGWALITGQAPGPGRAPLEPAPALFVGVFLGGWLAFWTLGGFLAGHELCRLVWSADHLLVRGDGLVITRRVGPIVRRRFLARATLRGFACSDGGSALQVETTDGEIVELTRNGTRAEREELLAAWAAELRLPAVEHLPPVLPAAWRVVPAPEGGTVVVHDPAPRRKVALVTWVLAVALTGIAGVVIRAAWLRPNLGAAAAMLAALAALALWSAARLTWVRDEWRLEPGRLVRQRRHGARRREHGAGTALRLTESTDSDGDRSVRLDLIGDGRGPITLEQRMQDGAELRRLGRWLAAQTGMTFADETTAEARAQREAARAAGAAAQWRLLRAGLGAWVRSLPGLDRSRK